MSVGAVIFVRDVGRMTAFYATILASAPVRLAEDGSWAEFDVLGSPVWIHGAATGPSDEGHGPLPTEPREGLPIKLVLPIDDNGSFSERVEGSGGTVISRPWGVDYCDPEGNVFGVRPAAND